MIYLSIYQNREQIDPLPICSRSHVIAKLIGSVSFAITEGADWEQIPSLLSDVIAKMTD